MATSHEGRRAVAAWKVARYEHKIAAAISAALAVHQRKVNSSGASPGTAPPDPFDLATWHETVQDKVHPAVHSVLSEIVGDVAKAAGIGAGVHLLGRTIGSSGLTVAQAVDEATDGIVQQASAVGERLAPRVSLVISTADDSSRLAASMNTLFNLADVNASLVARSANFFSNALATQAALTIHDENPMQKTWTTMGDDRVRPDHDDVDGTTLPADQAFDVGGDSLMYPGDPNGSDAEVANCRCWLVFEPLQEGAATGDSSGAEDDSLAAALAVTTLQLADAQGISIEDAESRVNQAVTSLVERGHTLPVRSDFRLPNRAERRQAARQARSRR
jgi:hypothetical protein